MGTLGAEQPVHSGRIGSESNRDGIGLQVHGWGIEKTSLARDRCSSGDARSDRYHVQGRPCPFFSPTLTHPLIVRTLYSGLFHRCWHTGKR